MLSASLIDMIKSSAAVAAKRKTDGTGDDDGKRKKKKKKKQPATRTKKSVIKPVVGRSSKKRAAVKQAKRKSQGTASSERAKKKIRLSKVIVNDDDDEDDEDDNEEDEEEDIPRAVFETDRITDLLSIFTSLQIPCRSGILLFDHSALVMIHTSESQRGHLRLTLMANYFDVFECDNIFGFPLVLGDLVTALKTHKSSGRVSRVRIEVKMDIIVVWGINECLQERTRLVVHKNPIKNKISTIAGLERFQYMDLLQLDRERVNSTLNPIKSSFDSKKVVMKHYKKQEIMNFQSTCGDFSRSLSLTKDSQVKDKSIRRQTAAFEGTFFIEDMSFMLKSKTRPHIWVWVLPGAPLLLKTILTREKPESTLKLWVANQNKAEHGQEATLATNVRQMDLLKSNEE
jgi:hypothetical protein